MHFFSIALFFFWKKDSVRIPQRHAEKMQHPVW